MNETWDVDRKTCEWWDVPGKRWIKYINSTGLQFACVTDYHVRLHVATCHQRQWDWWLTFADSVVESRHFRNRHLAISLFTVLVSKCFQSPVKDMKLSIISGSLRLTTCWGYFVHRSSPSEPRLSYVHEVN